MLGARLGISHRWANSYDTIERKCNDITLQAAHFAHVFTL